MCVSIHNQQRDWFCLKMADTRIHGNFHASVISQTSWDCWVSYVSRWFFMQYRMPPPVISWFITHLNIVISIIHYCCYSYKPTYYYYRAPSCLIIVQAKTNPIARRCKGQASYVDLLTLMHDQTRSRGNGTSLMERNVHQFCHALPSSKLT